MRLVKNTIHNFCSCSQPQQEQLLQVLFDMVYAVSNKQPQFLGGKFSHIVSNQPNALRQTYGVINHRRNCRVVVQFPVTGILK